MTINFCFKCPTFIRQISILYRYGTDWSKEYCTLHPLIVYFVEGDGNIQYNSLCFISDDKNHDENFV